jgi:glycosyltransferase involved in cell wall biosynthesis
MSYLPLVSVVMAAYKSAQFLPEAIGSVIAQTYPHWELHVVDDGSPDNTADVVRPFLRDPRIRYHYQENKGQASAKNRGLRSSRGELIAFLDADDMWASAKLEKQVPAFAGHPEIGLVHTRTCEMTEAGELLASRPRPNTPQGRITNDLFVDNVVSGMASILRRECLDRVGLFDESLSMGIDYDLWLRISAHYDIVFLDFVTYYYRQWPGQMSHRYEERIDNAFRIMEKFLHEHPGLVPSDVVRTAWAHTYCSRAYARFARDRRWRDAFDDYVRAIKHQPRYLPAWISIAKLFFWRD